MSDRCQIRAGPDDSRLSMFRLTDGGVLRGPATGPQPSYDTREQDGKIEVKLRKG